jgi:hypothetical protein
MALALSERCVSLCDFQYCGKATPMKDLAYFLVATVSGRSVVELEGILLKVYRDELCHVLESAMGESAATAVPSIECFSITLQLAYADLCRWMCGWGYWGAVSFLQSKTVALLNSLDGGCPLGSEEKYEAAMARTYPVPQEKARTAGVGYKLLVK